MIYVFVVHGSDCNSKDPNYKRCNCRKWFYNDEWKRFGWKDPRKTAGTRSWERATAEARRLDLAGQSQDGRKPVADAVREFLADKRQQGIVTEVIRKHERELDQLKAICTGTLDRITLSDLEAVRDTWTGVAITRRKKQERLRSFFHYCVRHGWLLRNPAVNLSRIKVEQKPTEVFTPEQFQQLIDATYKLGAGTRNPNVEKWRVKIRALILLMRWSGLRVGDAVGLRRDKLREDDSLMLYTQKTGTPVYIPLPPDVATLLRSLENSNPAYFFWSGNGLLKSAVADYQRSFYRLGVPGHCHMLRHTFATHLLSTGSSLEEVATLLGHSSVKITEKHYSHWVKARQERLEASVRKTWLTS